MVPLTILAHGQTQALKHACRHLRQRGISVVYDPCPAVTHVLLPVPSPGGGDLGGLADSLSRDITVIGGKLDHPDLAGYGKVDLLQDPMYLAQNARITAHCALQVVMDALSCTLDGLQVLVIGWGRIGKCLVQLLSAIGAQVTVAARKAQDRAMLEALGFRAVEIGQIDPSKYGLIYNTAPQPVLPECPGSACKIDLASTPGITGKDVIWARGLPNQLAPESSGRLIAERVISYLSEKEAGS